MFSVFFVAKTQYVDFWYTLFKTRKKLIANSTSASSFASTSIQRKLTEMESRRELNLVSRRQWEHEAWCDFMMQFHVQPSIVMKRMGNDHTNLWIALANNNINQTTIKKLYSSSSCSTSRLYQWFLPSLHVLPPMELPSCTRSGHCAEPRWWRPQPMILPKM